MNPPTPPRNPPSPFETIAALAKFSRIPECSPEFYQKHFDAIDLAGGMVGWMGSLFKPLAQGLAVTGAPLGTLAGYIEVTLQGAKLSEWDLQSLDNNMEQAALKLLPVLKDPDFPAYMEECRWPIEGMLESVERGREKNPVERGREKNPDNKNWHPLSLPGRCHWSP